MELERYNRLRVNKSMEGEEMSVNISCEIEKLIEYGLYNNLIKPEDKIYTRNRILEVLALDEIEYIELSKEVSINLEEILKNILEFAIEKGILENDSIDFKDLLDTKIMACLMPRPSEVINKFYSLYDEDKKKATEYYYNLSKASNYIRVDRIKKDQKWKVLTEYGDLDISINLSKPEKDPKVIAAAKNLPENSYPKCLLCVENEGYAGRLNHPARGNHRVIPLGLNDENWFLQYSPYVYYNEHCIVFKGKHEPMKISKDTFKRLLDFIEKVPHYFIGSNADLPIVGGSILTHDHFQGGNYEFAMAKAAVEKEFYIDSLSNVKVGKVKWPMSVIRVEGEDKVSILEAAMHIYESWKVYSDEIVNIYAYTADINHNTITPIARMKEGKFQLDLVLRNNITTEEHPDGLFHPHKELHHIKKENIGLIEVMGLAILPARLKEELKEVSNYIIKTDSSKELSEGLLKHKEWILDIMNRYEKITISNIDEIIEKEVGIKFLTVLEHAGVFKRDEEGQTAFDKFIVSLG